MLIVDKKKFNTGLGLLLSFLVVLAVMFSPVINGKTIITYSEELFNSLAKGSTYYIPAVQKSAAKYNGIPFETSLKIQNPAEGEKIAKLFSTTGAETKTGPDRVDIKGDLGKVSLAALQDADALFKGNNRELQENYGMDGKEIVYYWYTGINNLNKQYKQEARNDELSFTGTVMSKALEPAYNFNGINAVKVQEKMGVTGFLLSFYVIYTIWFGFAIMYMFEGLGVTATAAKEKFES